MIIQMIRLKIIIPNIINANLTKELLLKYVNNFMKKINIIKDVYNERRCKNPNFKLYIKSYAEYYKYNVIIEALINDKVNELNNNLKLFASVIKI